ncbi:RING finger protein vilya-like [Leptopilina boulardi]|uniref:RING finger protein vilya-like n=1 Tax=Leptopilina boulardi TaxID=63433 RepID=UPI0021F67110|nr:RING finger protein vilya-like [Leptopilina boulardi]
MEIQKLIQTRSNVQSVQEISTPSVSDQVFNNSFQFSHTVFIYEFIYLEINKIMTSEELGPKKWLRCNNCYILMQDCKAPFLLSYCSHIFCPKCVKKVTKKCPQCNAQNLRTMPLVEPLRPEVKHCFESVENLHDKFSQAITFQTQQLSINNKRFSAVDKKYFRAKVEYQQSCNDFKNSQKRIQELESELKLMQKKLYEFEEAHIKMHHMLNPSEIFTPQSLNSSVDSNLSFPNHSGSDVQSFAKNKSFQNTILTPLTPAKLKQMDLMNSKFRIPSRTKVPRSVVSSSKNSCDSSLKTPFTDFSPFINRRI